MTRQHDNSKVGRMTPCTNECTDALFFQILVQFRHGPQEVFGQQRVVIAAGSDTLVFEGHGEFLALTSLVLLGGEIVHFGWFVER